jgi:hypothetical protein
MTITHDDLKKWTGRGVMFIDGDGFYSNHYQCNEEPRLTYVKSGPAGLYRKRKKDEPERKHDHKWFVDGIECPDLDAVLTMLNAKPLDGGPA